MVHTLNYFHIPYGDDKHFNRFLEELLKIIGTKYGTTGNNPLKKGIKYIVSQINGGKKCHIKQMIRMNRATSTCLISHDKYMYKIHRENYCKYVEKIISVIINDPELLDKVNEIADRFNIDSCYQTVWEYAYCSLDNYISNFDEGKEQILALLNKINKVDYNIT